MRKPAWILLAVLIMTVAGAPAQESIADARDEARIDQEHTNWIDHVMRSVATIKPGMTRRDLFTVFSAEGGLSTRTHRRYVYKRCSYIKVDVEFSRADVDASPESTTENLDDKIVKISRHSEYSIMD